MRADKTEPNKFDVLTNLVRSTSYNEAVVQINPEIEWPGAHSLVDLNEQKIGLLHLGLGAHGQFEVLMPYLAKGAIVLMEGYTPESVVYGYAIDQAARGYLSMSELRHWAGVGVSVFLGASQ